ncbi:MAG: hypothetical protein WEC33_02385 [Dehalococcoidia bacterium]
MDLLGRALVLTAVVLVILAVGLAATNHIFPVPRHYHDIRAHRYAHRIDRSSATALAAGLFLGAVGLVLLLLG